jgi:ATP-dependent DNA helicase DinG
MGRTGEDAAEHPRPAAPDPRPVAADPPPGDSSRTAVTQGHAWTPESDEELRDGVELGLSLAELAESLELPEDVVAARLAGLGLEVDGSGAMQLD